MYTVRTFEIAKPANVVFSKFRLKDHFVQYALGYNYNKKDIGNLSIFWNDKGEAFSRDMTVKFNADDIKRLTVTKEMKSLKLYRVGGFLYVREPRFDLVF